MIGTMIENVAKSKPLATTECFKPHPGGGVRVCTFCNLRTRSPGRAPPPRHLRPGQPPRPAPPSPPAPSAHSAARPSLRTAADRGPAEPGPGPQRRRQRGMRRAARWALPGARSAPALVPESGCVAGIERWAGHGPGRRAAQRARAERRAARHHELVKGEGAGGGARGGPAARH